VLKESVTLVAYRRLVVDVLATAASFLLAHQLRSHLLPLFLPKLFPGGLYPIAQYLPVLAVVVPVWGALLAAHRLATPGAMVSLGREVLQLARVVGLGVGGVAAASYLLRVQFISRPFLVLFALTNLAVLAALRLAERRTAWGRALVKAPERVVVVVGDGPRAHQVARLVEQHRHWGFRLKGLLTVDEKEGGTSAPYPILGTVADLAEILTGSVVDEVLLAVPTRQLGELEDALLQCQELGVRLRVVLQPFPHLKPRVEVETLQGVPFLTFATSPTAPLALFTKRVMDVVLSAAALVASLPLWPVIALAIRLSSPGPVFYRQERCGLHGRRFTLLKFRTMTADAEARRQEVAHLNVVNGPAFKAPDDPRITPVGRVLRRFSLDELPQLLHVLKGEMSLVGPRPPLPEEVERYEPWQRRRLAMKPGITGLWQVSGRSELDWATWMELDLAYIDSWSLWLDITILARTLPAVLAGRGAA
jgi:exopolysaccharide biosynthesis polyprenyl glycosylphosphotransferase